MAVQAIERGPDERGPRYARYRVTDDTRRAMEAVSQWQLGSPGWAEMFISVAMAEDPIAFAEEYWLDGERVGDVLP